MSLRLRSHLLACLFTLAQVSSCSESGAAPASHVVVDTIGDTVQITNVGTSIHESPFLVDQVRQAWRSDRLAWPGGVAVLENGEVAIADRDRIHVISVEGEYRRTLGRPGEGPGEFGTIVAIGKWRGDSLVVLDSRLRRLTWVSANGAPGRTILVAGPSREAAYVREVSLVAFEDGALLPFEQGWVDVSGNPPTVVLAWVPFDFKTPPRPIAVLRDHAMIRTPKGVIVPKALYGPEAIYAVSQDGKVAYTEGEEYCINIQSVRGSSPTRICRDLERQRIPQAIRAPSDARLSPLSKDEADDLRDRLQVQEVGEFWNSIEQLVFDSDERLWVRRVNTDAEFDSMILGPHPELAPSRAVWDVFDPTGRYLAEVSLPRNFNVRLIAGRQIFGVYQLPHGELALGIAEVPPAL